MIHQVIPLLQTTVILVLNHILCMYRPTRTFWTYLWNFLCHWHTLIQHYESSVELKKCDFSSNSPTFKNDIENHIKNHIYKGFMASKSALKSVMGTNILSTRRVSCCRPAGVQDCGGCESLIEWSISDRGHKGHSACNESPWIWSSIVTWTNSLARYL